MKEIKQRKTGEIAAILLSVWLGIVAITLTHLWSYYNPLQANPILLNWGSWIPSWWAIGPYTGKETAGLVVWLGTWTILHWTLGRIEVKLKPWTIGFAIAFIVNLIILWPTVYHTILWWPSLPNTLPGGEG